MPKRRHRSKPEQSQEELVAEHRRRCRGPEWWSRYNRDELAELHRGSRELREQGYGSDQTYMQWKQLLGER